MGAGFSVETHPRCASYGVDCSGYEMIEVVKHPDGTVCFEPVSPNCGREYCDRRDKPEAVIGKVEEWFSG